MRHILILIAVFMLSRTAAFAQKEEDNGKERLDFATTYFELGGTFFPSFTGKKLADNDITTFKNPGSVNQYLTWGAMHFWGHAEFYVTFPLDQASLRKKQETSFSLTYYTTTGARFYPWAYRENKFRPYVGLSWAALEMKQETKPDGNSSMLSKDFMLAYEAGLRYGYRNFALRLGVNFIPDRTWNYPLSKTQKTTINTPGVAFQLGLSYAMDLSKRTDQKTIDTWNSYPKVSKLSLGSTKFGDFFVGVGPSLSYSLTRSEYNRSKFPYLKDRLSSNNYFDIAAGYHFYRAGIFTALSFRNPKYETEGYGSRQTIRKTSFAWEINKFLVDYSGFAPYLGVNIAYDKLKYTESVDGAARTFLFDNTIEPGITLGWDIRPGKNTEALILRTNLRWYPYASFKIDGVSFNFSQLEYNLIQLVLYPGKLGKRRRTAL